MTLPNLVTGPVPTPAEFAAFGAEVGAVTDLARFQSGDAEARVQRFDCKYANGSVESTYELIGDWSDNGSCTSTFGVYLDDLSRVRDILAVLDAAYHFAEENCR